MPNPYPMWCSSLGTGVKCSRFLYHTVKDKDKRPPFSPELKVKLNYFADLEEYIIKKLERQGWHIIETQHRVAYNLGDNKVMSGKADLIAIPPEHEPAGIFEIKTTNENMINQTFDIHSLINHSMHYFPGQVAQWIMYLYSGGKDYGAIIQFCRDNGQMKIHYGSIIKGHRYYSEALFDFACEVINKVDVAWQWLLQDNPEGFCDNLAICQKCDWKKVSVCYPPIVNEGIETGFNQTHDEKDVARMLEIEPIKSEHKKLKDGIEAPLKVYIKDHKNPDEGFLIGNGKYHASAKVAKNDAITIKVEQLEVTKEPV